jgi:hypothetical protein
MAIYSNKAKPSKKSSAKPKSKTTEEYRVEEITNGFVVTKTCRVEDPYSYKEEKTYYKENPLKDKI